MYLLQASNEKSRVKLSLKESLPCQRRALPVVRRGRVPYPRVVDSFVGKTYNRWRKNPNGSSSKSSDGNSG